MATTAFCYSAKQELMQSGHCFNATQTGVAFTATTTTAIAGLASTAGLAVGMVISGTNWNAGTVISNIVSATAVTASAAPTASVSSATFTGDVFKMLLIKVSPSLTYSGTQTNVGTPGSGAPTTANVGTDETSGTGYTSGGTTLGNVTPTLAATSTAITNFSPNPSWTPASFSCTAGIIYNSSTRLGAAAAPLNGRTISVHDFGGTQTVSGGPFTVVMPTADQNNANTGKTTTI